MFIKMKNILLYILFFQLTAKAQQNTHVNNGVSKMRINSGSLAIKINYYFQSGIVNDDGHYNAFPQFTDEEGNVVYGVYEKTSSHAADGNITLVKTQDKGRTWQSSFIVVAGDTAVGANFCFIRVSSRLIICYRKSSGIYMAWSDNGGSTWTASASHIDDSTGRPVYPCPVKMIKSPQGKILFSYYVPTDVTFPAKGILMESADTGKTWANKSTIFSHNTFALSAPISDWRGNEVGFNYTEEAGTDAGSKMIAIVRVALSNDGGTYPMFFKSNNGGSTWYQDTLIYNSPSGFTDDNGAVQNGNFSECLLYNFLNGNNPFDIKRMGDSVYVVAGERNGTYGYALKVISAKYDSAFSSHFTNWTRPRFIKYYHALIAGASTDCGYPCFFQAEGHLFVADYDVSTQTPNSFADRRCLVEIVKIK